MKKIKAGIQITQDRIRSALIFKKGSTFAIKRLGDIDIPPGVIKPSFKKENITDINTFDTKLDKVLSELNTKKIAVSLPDASVQILLRKYFELPEDIKQVEEMITWDVSGSLNASPGEIRLSWEDMGTESDGGRIFLVALSMDHVMAQYEGAFKRAGIKSLLLSPSGLNQFNFYSSKIPESGNSAYLGMFDEFVNIFVFRDGAPLFYKSIKKGNLSSRGISAIDDVDLLIHYYNAEHPDLPLEKIFIASHIKRESEINQILQDASKAKFEIMEERDLISFDKNIEIHPDSQPLPVYTGVIGAAQAI